MAARIDQRRKHRCLGRKPLSIASLEFSERSRGHGGPGQVRAGEPYDANFGRPEKRKAATMQIRLTRTANESRTGHMKIVRVPSTVHAVPRLHDIVLPSRPQPKADQPQSARAVPV